MRLQILQLVRQLVLEFRNFTNTELILAKFNYRPALPAIIFMSEINMS
jgi:hypothetical protein